MRPRRGARLVLAGLLSCLLATLTVACSPIERLPLASSDLPAEGALLGEGNHAAWECDGKVARPAPRIEVDAPPPPAAGSNGLDDFDDVVLFPFVVGGPGPATYAGDCDPDDPYGYCL